MASEEHINKVTEALLLSFKADSTEKQKQAEAVLTEYGKSLEYSLILLAIINNNQNTSKPSPLPPF